MTSRDDVVGRLTLASGHPWGPTRSGLTAEAVAMADELGDDQMAVDARLALAEARHRGNEEWKGLGAGRPQEGQGQGSEAINMI